MTTPRFYATILSKPGLKVVLTGGLPMPASAAKDRKIITDKVVVEKTGKTMEEWFAVLDKKGAKRLDSHGIYDLIKSIDGLKPLGEWNQGLLSTSYQWSRGLRERGEKKDGFEVGVSKTIGVPLELLYRAFADDKLRMRWLPEKKVSITKATENKSARVAWIDGETRLSIDFYKKGDEKSQIVVQHLRLPNSEKAAQMKEYWSTTLEKLKSILE
jgi:activator of Hsp90 ATPase-like protein